MKRPLAVISLVLGLSVICGCGGSEPLPELNRVTGLVKRAGKPVRGGQVQFVPVEGSARFTIQSQVGQDGTYTLTTAGLPDPNQPSKSGVPAGVYKVRYTPPDGDRSSAIPIELPNPVTVGGNVG